MEESQWSQAKAVEWAKGLRHWPARRFRVEKSRAGNSRLVSLRVAHEMKDKYGGEIVELIEHAAIQLGRSMKKCKQCDAKAGAPCKSGAGNLRKPHSKRAYKKGHGPNALESKN
jgi:hypothetical protein